MLLLCYRLVGQPKTKRLGHPEWFFLIELLGFFFKIPAKRERRREKQQRALTHKNTPQTQQTHHFLGFLETLARFRDVSVLNDRACSWSSDILLQTCAHSWETFSDPFRTCRVGILAEIKAPSFQKRNWHDEICSSDLLNVFTGGRVGEEAIKTNFAPHR